MKVPYDRSGLRFYLTGFGLILGQATSTTILAGVPILYLGVILHFWAKGCLHQDAEVTRTGPYRFVRHPFYLATLMIDTGIVIMAGSWILAAIFPFWWFTIYIRTMRREEAYLARHFPEDLNAFRLRVPALFPLRRPLASVGKGFSWSNTNISEGSEISRALHIAVYPLLFHVVGRLRSDGWAFFADDGPHDILWLEILLMFYALSWMTKLHFRKGRIILPRPTRLPEVRVLLITAVLLVAVPVDIYELDLQAPSLAVGLLLYLIALAALIRRAPWSMHLAEGLFLTGTLVLCEIPWLSLAPILYYAALMLDDWQEIKKGRPDEPASPFLLTARSGAVITGLTIVACLLAVALDLYAG